MPPIDGNANKSFQKISLEKKIRYAPKSDILISGTWNLLVILIDFPDYTWDNQSDPNFDNTGTPYTPAHFNNMLFSQGVYKHPKSVSNYTGSMRDFYLENSYGNFDISGTVVGWVRANNNYTYYCNNNGGWGPYPNSIEKLVEEAIAKADSLGVDFSNFDNNKDRFAESVLVIHSGPGAEALRGNLAYIWSHLGGLRNPVTVDGITISEYTTEPEDGTIGVFCHEYGHTLGLPDLYGDDTSEGIGEWGLMGSGGWCRRAGDPYGTSPSHFSAWEKSKLGWITPINVTSELVDISIPPVEINPVAYRIWRNGQIGVEYFLVENRQNIGFDEGLTRRQKYYGLPDANGLIIFHITEDYSAGEILDVEEASPYIDGNYIFEQLDAKRIIPNDKYLTNGNRGDNGDPFPGYTLMNDSLTDYILPRDRNIFSDTSIPNSKDHLGNSTNVAIYNIRIDNQNIIANFSTNYSNTFENSYIPEINNTSNLFTLNQNYPNPFNTETTIRYEIGETGDEGRGTEEKNNDSRNLYLVSLKIYTTTGQLVNTLVHQLQPSGHYNVIWNGCNSRGKSLSNGIYIYKLVVSKDKELVWRDTKKLLLLK